MVDECANNPLFKSDILRVTNAPNIISKNIVHLVAPQAAGKIADHLLKAFEVVEKILILQSIAIPAIGTGKLSKRKRHFFNKLFSIYLKLRYFLENTNVDVE